jgi:hypothetical protein
MGDSQPETTNQSDSGDDVKHEAEQRVSNGGGDIVVAPGQIVSAADADTTTPAESSTWSHDNSQLSDADTVTQDDASITTTSSDGAKPKYLEDYIRRAYTAIPGFPEPSSRIFTRSPGPELQHGRENRIILYPGCFNPPHAGHAALLWHTYLNTDANTIAVMIFALRDGILDCKDHVADGNGKKFILSHYQRRQLWQDDVLGRFAWVVPVNCGKELRVFIATVKQLAEVDGFRISFPTLYGGDHITREKMAEDLWGWDGGTCIGSDVTRPMDFVPEDGSDLIQLEDCDKWKKMKNEGQVWSGKEGRTPSCWPCWPCAKMCNIFPESVEDNGTFSFGKTSLPVSLDRSVLLTYETDKMDSKHPLATILARCHFPNNALQWTRRTRNRGYIIFVPSNRITDPDSPLACPTISATALREALLKLEVATQQFRDEIMYAIPNLDLLCIYLGLDCLWRINGTGKRLIDGKRCEDDVLLDRLRKRQGHQQGANRRRASFI